jgi:hypothetical protein
MGLRPIVPILCRNYGVSKMNKREAFFGAAMDAVAWADPSLARRAERDSDRSRSAQPPPACEAAEGVCGESSDPEPTGLDQSAEPILPVPAGRAVRRF